MAVTSKEIEYVIKVRDQATVALGGLKKAAIGATAALAGIALVTKQAIEFESSFAGVRKTVDASEAEFQQLSKNFRQLATQVPVNVNQLNKIAEMAGQLGVSGVENLTKFTDTVAKIAVTTNLSEEQAATSFARIANVMQAPINDIDRMASSVVALGNNFATTESEIVDFATRIAGSANLIGLTSDQVFGIAAAFSSVGIQAEAGGTAVQKIFIDLNKQGKKGIGAFQDFVKNLQDAGDGAVQVLEDLGFSDARLQRAFLSLAGAGGLLEESIRKSTEAFAENVALTDEANKRFETTESQMILLKNQMNELGIVLGSTILPAINDFIKALTPAIIKISQWAEAHPKLTKFIIGSIAAISALIIVATTLTAVVAGVAAAVASGAAALAGGIVFATGVAIAAIGLVIATFDQWVVVAKFALEQIKNAFILTMQFLVALITLDFETMFNVMVTWGKSVLEHLTILWDNLKTFWNDSVNAISTEWMEMLKKIEDALFPWADTVRAVFSEVFTWIRDSITGIISLLSGAVSTVQEMIGLRRRSTDATDSRTRRAMGGYTTDKPTIVGEHGPEMIFPPSGAFVASANKTRGMSGGSQINVNIRVDGSLIGASKRELAAMVGDQVMRSLGPLISRPV